ncbi:MAG: DNA repair protein RecN [Kiritimatiellae bacterium]|nr:DNA repair protein RecN [Kiritimatiellia bacterium]
MLEYLKVKNLAIVENAEVHFAPGLNIVTGETGSGKSVLIGALSLILGERADHGAIRTGTPEMSVEAGFSITDPLPVDTVLADSGLPPCEEGQLLVRRVVSANGTGRCWINDSPATLATLRRLGENLIDMHGPYDHQSLLSPDFQLSLLDAFGHTSRERAAYGDRYRAWQDLRREREELEAESDGNVEEEIDRLRFIVEEIDNAALNEEDGDSLVERHAQAANAGEIIQLGNAIVNGLTDDDASVFDSLALVQQRICELARILPEAEAWHEEAEETAVRIQELSRTITDRLQRVEADPELLAQLEERLALVQKLKRKYGPSLEEIAAYRDAKKERLDMLLGKGARLAALTGEIAAAESAARKAGAALTAARSKAAAKLAKAITAELRPLGFAQSLFKVEITPREPVASGLDNVVFSFAPNPGEPAMALRAIASSGEIARVMLAVKSVLAEQDSIPLLVFDEIDSNIGGEVGRAVGRKLRALAKTHQIISITHLPQVAAYGEAHFSVSKRVDGSRTRAFITPLDDKKRAEEIARMLGGSDFTSVTLEHAREMIARCAEQPNG